MTNTRPLRRMTRQFLSRCLIVFSELTIFIALAPAPPQRTADHKGTIRLCQRLRKDWLSGRLDPLDTVVFQQAGLERGNAAGPELAIARQLLAQPFGQIAALDPPEVIAPSLYDHRAVILRLVRHGAGRDSVRNQATGERILCPWVNGAILHRLPRIERR